MGVTILITPTDLGSDLGTIVGLMTESHKASLNNQSNPNSPSHYLSIQQFTNLASTCKCIQKGCTPSLWSNNWHAEVLC